MPNPVEQIPPDAEEKAETAVSPEGDDNKEGEKDAVVEEDKKDDAPVDASTYEPPTRVTPWNNRGERAEFFKNKQKETKETPVVGESDKDDDDPKDFDARVASAVQKVLSPVYSSLQDQSDSSEITSFLANPANAHFKKFEHVVRKEAKVYQNVPIDKLFKAHDYENVGKRSSQTAEKIKQKVKQNRIGPGIRNTSKSSDLPDFKDPKALAQFNREIARGKTVQVEE